MQADLGIEPGSRAAPPRRPAPACARCCCWAPRRCGGAPPSRCIYAVYAWVARRDWRFGLVVVGVVSTWLPWFRYDDRPIFSFYAIAILPFT